MEQWAPIVIAVCGSAVSGYLGVKVAMARIEERMAAFLHRLTEIENEIGDRKSGIRGQLHEHNAALFRLDTRVTAIEEKLRK